MKWIVLATALIIFLCIASSGQPNAYSTTTTGGAPTPTAPSSPESIGMSIPSTITASGESPSVQESGQSIVRSSEQAAYRGAPQATGSTAVGSTAMGSTATGSTATGSTATGSTAIRSTATSPTYTQATYPPGGQSQNRLYISYAPQTVASCNLYANLPLWMQISGRGNIWFYEWYPNGSLETSYAGNVYSPGWYKRWFFADVPGWHILQFYCNGWSNYAYIYVYGPRYWVSPYSEPAPTPYPNPYPYPYPYSYEDDPLTYTYTSPQTGHTYYNYN